MTNLRCLLAALLVGIFSYAHAQSNLWKDVQRHPEAKPLIQPETYRVIQVDFEMLKSSLLSIANSENPSSLFSIPDPEGGFCEMTLSEASVMERTLQDKYPDIRTFRGSGKGKYEGAYISIDYTLKGFHAQILMPEKTFYIDPYGSEDLNTYIVYTRTAFYNTNTKQSLPCETFGESAVMKSVQSTPEERSRAKANNEPLYDVAAAITNGTQLRTYRLALACTGEYAQYHGGTVPLALSAMTTTLNRINGIYERDASVRMQMIANNDLLIHLNSSTDPYTNNDLYAMLEENRIACNNIVGNSNFDIGHVFGTTGGGVAYLSVACNSFYKAQGVSGSWSPYGDPFDVDIASHEFGHQFGGDHSFNNSCGGNRNGSTAYEPGSGSTIMAYAGVCSPSLQNNSDPFFHNHSLNQIYNYTVTGSGNSCAVKTSTGNTPPTVSIPDGGFYIPKQTPFELTGSASDSNGDILTYSWEQHDLGPATNANDNQLTNPSGNAPIFRSWAPSESPTRVFPRLSDLVNNTTTIGELLPTYTRDLSFKFTARDNSLGGGGIADAEISFHVAGNSGPFVVTQPNTAVTWLGNSSKTITWNVSNTQTAPVNCSHVDIYLSTDGGYTYPITLLSNTPNNGSATVTIPNVSTSAARIKVKASNNIFFDISNQNFTIEAAPELNYDVALTSIVHPDGELCGSSQIVPEITILNLGNQTLTSVQILANIDGLGNTTTSWTGSLSFGQSENITLQAMPMAAAGSHVINVVVQNPNGQNDENNTNNNLSNSFTITNLTGEALPVQTDFSNGFPGAGWTIENPDGAVTWGAATVANDVNCQSKTVAKIEFFSYNIFYAEDYIVSPWIDLNDATAPELSFAYAYARYSSSYYDRMKIEILVGCEETWITLWDKENLNLATAGSSFSAYVPQCGDWVTETIDLSAYTGNTVKIRVAGISGYGNNLYIDHISIAETAIDCAGVIGGTATPGTSCETNGMQGVYTEDCDCEPVLTASIDAVVFGTQICDDRYVAIEIMTPGGTTAIMSKTGQISSSGTMTISGLPLGEFDIRVKINGFLSKLYSNETLVEGTNDFVLGNLINGDINNDNVINIADFSILNFSIFTTLGDTNFNEDADLNCDGVINIIDFSIFNSGFWLVGE